MITGLEKQVLQVTPCRVKPGSSAASSAVSTTGMYSGRHPAITALIATFSTVQGAMSGGMRPTTSAGSRRVPPSIRRMRSGVGGTTGRPSVQPRSWHASAGSVPRAQFDPRARIPASPKRTRSASRTPGSTEREPQPGRCAGRLSPSVGRPVRARQSSRFQPSVRPASRSLSRRISVGTVSISSRNDCSSSRSSADPAARPGPEKGAVVLPVHGERAARPASDLAQHGDHEVAGLALVLHDGDEGGGSSHRGRKIPSLVVRG